MRIIDPRYFWILIMIVPLWILSFVSNHRSRTYLKRLGYGSRSVVDNRYRVRSFLRFLLINGICLFSVLALVDFHWGLEPESNEKRNLDVALVVDVSNSMLARDVGSSRLDRCRDAMFLLMENLPKARYSFTLFKGEPVLFIPLTEDTITLENFLEKVSPAFISAPGSNLEKALQKGASTLPENQERNRAVLLFTDGEGLEGNGLNAARELYDRNIQLFTFGLGSGEGDFIRLENGELLTDREGEPVVTRQNSELLKQMADLTGGRYLDLTDVHNMGEIETLLSDTYGQTEARGVGFTSTNRYRIFALAALVFMAFYLIMGKLRWN